MGHSNIRSLIWILIVTSCLSVASLATASEDRTVLGLFAGVTELEPDLADDGTTFGLQVSRTARENSRVVFTVGCFKGDLRSEDGATGLDIGYKAIYVDLNESVFLNADGAVRPMFTVGIGWAWPSIDDTLTAEDLGPLYDQFESDTFTVNGGVGLEFWIADKAVITPAVRAKWFEVRRRDEVDLEATLGIGFAF